MKHESKTVHVDERPSFAGSLITIFAGQGARAADSKTTRENLPGKSRVGRILLNDNHSQDRLLGMKLADIHQMRRKTETFISHQQKTFIAKMEKRQNTWVREHARFSNNTNLVKPPDERWDEVPPTREAAKSRCVEGEAAEATKGDAEEKPAQAGEGSSGALPNITYLTEGSENSPRDGGGNGETIFAKEPDPYERAPRLFGGLPPITHAKKLGFQPSGNIDDLFDDKAMKRSQTKWPPNRNADGGNEDPAQSHNLPALDTSDPNAVTAGKESRMSAIQDDEHDESSERRTPTPVFLLSHSLPRIHVQEPQSRKLRARRGQNPVIRRKRLRHLSDARNDTDNPLADERFLKLHDLLASDVVADHETRELSALARGVLAAKKFGQNWKGT